MDISQIKASIVTPEVGIHVGDKEAPVKVMSFINLRCPYCREWNEKSKDVLTEFIQAGKIELIIKPFDKEKESLQRGNVAHRYLDYSTPEKTRETINKIYSTQGDWGNLSLEEVATYMEATLGLTEQDNKEASEKIIREANEANIVFVPTVIVGEHIFDEHISPEQLRTLLNDELTK
ncbi:DsbA family protein [Listeria sp. FSL L7-1485]|uniref:DsbA family protein n=1 Tax=Listeria immobilis TaxID=2713502 RepID=A0A7X0X8S2_9LIST|nr:DsbA family protein [Listeria immobilis]MBC1484274.1 DsbA family protein [Listeria immobilis]MBC1489281.1 DsbA family protein [Listeria immobilis]MBC1507833.1 DsbA family protein [Listeria immobilis]MBC1510816.1 DsbA family protein [Listeria immobilis]MBC1515056.1 DsbA family protein [Listeria immobilis]